MGRDQGVTDRRPVERLDQVARLAARQVDQIRLADGLRGARVISLGAAADEDRLDLGTELAEMGHPHRRPALEHGFAVGERGGRQDHHPRAPDTGRGEQARIEGGHRGKELAGADERHRTGHTA